MHAAQLSERAAFVLNNVWILVVIGQLVRRYSETAHEENVIWPAVFVDLHRPAGASLGVPRRQMSGQTRAAKFDTFAIRNDPVGFYGFICKIITIGEVSFAAHRSLAPRRVYWRLRSHRFYA